jgi:hypothetical protein
MASDEEAMELNARALAEGYLKARFPGQSLMIQDDHTIAFDGGWMFFWNSAEFVRTWLRKHALFGNAPIIVSKTGRITVTGTSHAGRDFLEAYRALGADRFEAGEWREWIAEHRRGRDTER